MLQLTHRYFQNVLYHQLTQSEQRKQYQEEVERRESEKLKELVSHISSRFKLIQNLVTLVLVLGKYGGISKNLHVKD